MLRKRKQHWKDPKVRKRHIEALKKAAPKISVSLSRRWHNSAFYAKMLKARKKQAQVHRETYLEAAENISCDVRKARSERIRKWNKSDEGRKNNSDRMKKLWSDSDYRAKQIKAIHNKKWRRHVAKSNTLKKTGKPSWNAGLTKKEHPGLMAASLKLKGHLPKFNLFKRWYPSDDERRIEMRSSWEVSFALWLDAGGIDWEYESQYFHVGRGIWKGETYTPDFYLPAQKVYVELKGRLSEENAAKMKRFHKLYPDIQLWMFEYKHLKDNVLQFRKAA